MTALGARWRYHPRKTNRGVGVAEAVGQPRSGSGDQGECIGDARLRRVHSLLWSQPC